MVSIIKNMVSQPLAWIFTAIILGAFGQVSITTGMRHLGAMAGINIKLLRAYSNPFVFGGLVLYGLSTLFWLMALSRRELSYCYPLISFGYVLVTFLAWLFFKEHISVLRLSGLTLICMGVILAARS